MGYFFINQHLRLVDSHLPLCHFLLDQILCNTWGRFFWEDSPRKPMSTLVELPCHSQRLNMNDECLVIFYIKGLWSRSWTNRDKISSFKRKTPCEPDLNPPKKKRDPDWTNSKNESHRTPPTKTSLPRHWVFSFKHSKPWIINGANFTGCTVSKFFSSRYCRRLYRRLYRPVECGSWCSNCDPFRNFFHTTQRLYPDVLLIPGL